MTTYEKVRLYREDYQGRVHRHVLHNTIIPRTPIQLLARKAPPPQNNGVLGRRNRLGLSFPTTIGTVTNIHRAEDGWVVGDLTTDDVITGAHCMASFTRGKNDRYRIYSVTLGDEPAWVDMEIRDAS